MQSWTMYDSSLAASRQLSGVRMAPILPAAKKASTYSTPLWARMATRSPLSTPRLSRALARRLARSSSSP